MLFNNWTKTLGAWLRTVLAAQMAKEPRMWTLPPDQHVDELILHASFALGWLTVSAPGLGESDVLVGRPTRGELGLGLVLALFVVFNLSKKLFIEDAAVEDAGARGWIEMLLPCHVYNMLAAYSLLGCSRRAREATYNLLLYCAWMPLLAMLFPDLEDTVKIRSPLARVFSIGMFWVHHAFLLLLPGILGWYAKLGRFRVPPSGLRAFAQYLAFANAYIGVFLCAYALLTGRNINYSLWPPPALPDSMVALVGGHRYRVSIGLLLAFVVGPAMRFGFFPAATWLVTLGAREAKPLADRARPHVQRGLATAGAKLAKLASGVQARVADAVVQAKAHAAHKTNQQAPNGRKLA